MRKLYNGAHRLHMQERKAMLTSSTMRCQLTARRGLVLEFPFEARQSDPRTRDGPSLTRVTNDTWTQAFSLMLLLCSCASAAHFTICSTSLRPPLHLG